MVAWPWFCCSEIDFCNLVIPKNCKEQGICLGSTLRRGVIRETLVWELGLTKRLEANEIARLFDEHSAALALFAAQRTSSPDDCVQEAFVALAALTSRPGNTVAWLYRVVRNKALNQNRTRQRRLHREKRVARSEFEPDTLSKLESSEEQKLLLDALQELQPDQRELIVLRIWSGQTWNEIADLIGKSSSSAQRHYVVALESIKKRLESKCVTKPQ